MEPITYHKKFAASLKDPLLRACFCGLLAVAVILGLFLRDPDLESVITTTVLVLVVLFPTARIFRLARPKHNMLKLEHEGFTYKFGGESLFWPWRELSTFTFEGECARITFTPARGKAWRPGWIRMKSKPGQLGAILDSYDAPLQDILAKLNAHRSQALEVGPGSNKPAQ